MLTSSANTATAAIIARVEHLSGCPVTLLRDPYLPTLATVKGFDTFDTGGRLRYSTVSTRA